MREPAMIIGDLAAAGLTPDQMALVMELALSTAMETRQPKDATAERRRAKDRERKRLRNSTESAEFQPPLETKGFPQTPIQKLNPPAPPLPPTGEFPPQPKADLFEEAWNAYPASGRERSNAKAKIRPVWRDAARSAGGEPRLAEAVRRYARLDKTHRGETGAPAFQRWLRDGRWEHWLGDSGEAAVPLHTFADADVRAAAVIARDEGWVRAWLDPSEWDATARSITPRNGLAVSRLKDLAGLWKTLNVTVQAKAA